MVDYFDPEKLVDTAAASLRKDLGQQAELEGELVELQKKLDSLPESAPEADRAKLQLEVARVLQIIERGEEAWPLAMTAFGIFSQIGDWESAADACDVAYQTNHEDALVALGHGIWIGVTFPIDPEITVHLLSHVIDDTPDDSDGAAVAAAAACFLADVRAEPGPEQERLSFFAQQLLGKVARRHSNIDSQEQFRFWIEKLELNEPDKFFVRLRNVVDVLVQENWWIDRDAIQASLPE